MGNQEVKKVIAIDIDLDLAKAALRYEMARLEEEIDEADDLDESRAHEDELSEVEALFLRLDKGDLVLSLADQELIKNLVAQYQSSLDYIVQKSFKDAASTLKEKPAGVPQVSAFVEINEFTLLNLSHSE